jgi:hypothetical protein
LKEFEILRQRSIEDIESASILIDNEKYDQAIELSHFALEKIMKSALGKQGLDYPLTHDLIVLANIKYRGKKYLLSQIKTNPTMLDYWTMVRCSWTINYRYSFMKNDPMDFDELFLAYRGLTRWIRAKLVE